MAARASACAPARAAGWPRLPTAAGSPGRARSSSGSPWPPPAWARSSGTCGRTRATMSPELEAIHGLAPGEFDGSAEMMMELVHPDDRDEFLAGFARAIGRGRPIRDGIPDRPSERRGPLAHRCRDHPDRGGRHAVAHRRCRPGRDRPARRPRTRSPRRRPGTSAWSSSSRSSRTSKASTPRARSTSARRSRSSPATPPRNGSRTRTSSARCSTLTIASTSSASSPTPT